MTDKLFILASHGCRPEHSPQCFSHRHANITYTAKSVLKLKYYGRNDRPILSSHRPAMSYVPPGKQRNFAKQENKLKHSLSGHQLEEEITKQFLTANSPWHLRHLKQAKIIQTHSQITPKVHMPLHSSSRAPATHHQGLQPLIIKRSPLIIKCSTHHQALHCINPQMSSKARLIVDDGWDTCASLPQP